MYVYKCICHIYVPGIKQCDRTLTENLKCWIRLILDLNKIYWQNRSLMCKLKF